MYEVLPLEMRLAGRPEEEIERAMLSRADFRTIELSSMILSAAYLSRFKQYPRALHLYRQASSLNPSRPEPYALGLRLAEELGNDEAVRWAAMGILKYVWTANHERLHRRAENAILDLEQRLRRSEKTEVADKLVREFQEAQSRDLIIALRWQGNADLDLIIEEPTGTICSLQHPQSPAGGVLVHDGMGPQQKETYEKIVYPMAVSGAYRVRITHVWGKVVAKRAVLTVTRHQGTSREKVRTRTIALRAGDTVVNVQLQQGRREQPVPVSLLEANQAAPRSAVRSTAGRLRNPTAASRRARQAFLDSRRRSGGGNRRGGAGFQPVITVIPEGASLTARAIVSGDRRYVRISLSPTFSNITDVFTFSFLNTGGQPAQNTGGGN